ncbi:SigE family RNA polymerase sigma factor [Cryptosporangium phraense]|uniref:SigE family RNA polymerase sigma factor n=1 Tax=Cryptosporangium phraense TaxID=2593070 RepID=A0A545AMK3_9ACTN|nr:SigE family RNA polymerase sigma factor [Cryptosporangium phraense]
MTFDDFVADRLDPLLRYATVLCYDPHLARDIVQEVLLRAQQRWPHISTLDSPSAYVKRMVTNEFLSWRRRKATGELTTSTAVLNDLGTPTADAADQHAERAAMLAQLAQLPRRQRVVLVLRRAERARAAGLRKRGHPGRPERRSAVAPPGLVGRCRGRRARRGDHGRVRRVRDVACLRGDRERGRHRDGLDRGRQGDRSGERDAEQARDPGEGRAADERLRQSRRPRAVPG